VDEVKRDIQAMKDIADQIRQLSRKLGEEGRVSRNILRYIYDNAGQYNEYSRNIASWLYYGGENAFLQDANSLIIKTPELLEILNFLREKFPRIARVTSYCRSHTAARKSVDEFTQLKNAGLTRIHIGMESGSDNVLSLIHKGVTAEDHIKAGLNIIKAGIELSEYVMPGLGGVKWTRDHALQTARVLNEINPDFIRLRTLHVVPGTGLDDIMQKGDFSILSDDEVIREIQLFMENLNVRETILASDHVLNLLEELEGKLPEDKPKLLSVIQRYFELSVQDRLIFRLGRRSGALRKISDLEDKDTYLRLKSIIDNYSEQGGNIDEDIVKIMDNYI
jgi:radical SAM superfamily enzyme YgiQ (UPF0313 family)